MKIAFMLVNIHGVGGRVRVVCNLANELLSENTDIHIISRQGEPGQEIHFPLNPQVTIHHLGISFKPKTTSKFCCFINFRIRKKVLI